jgi:hypothetical protein
MRGTFVYDRDLGKLVPKAEVMRRRAAASPSRLSGLPSPAVHGAMPPIQCMADGRVYDDKRSYHKAVARAGCEVVGFDKGWERHIPPAYDEKAHTADVVADIKRAIEEVG